MRHNLSKHKILKVLADKMTSAMGTDGKVQADMKVPKQEIVDLFKKNEKLHAVIMSELFASNEIKYLEASNSYIIEPIHGLNSFSNKKYINKNWAIILTYLKNFAQIFIPIAALAVAAMTLWIKIGTQNDTHNKQIKDIESRLESVEKLNEKIEVISKTQDSDSLTVK